jgi:Fascin domain-containing protein
LKLSFNTTCRFIPALKEKTMKHRTYSTVVLLAALLFVSMSVTASLAVQPQPTPEAASFAPQATIFRHLALLADNRKYVAAEDGGGRELIANRDRLGPWETFNVTDLGNDRIALQTNNGKYVSAEGGGGGEVVANRDRIGPWETFRVIRLRGKRIALQTSNGQYVTAEDGGGRPLVANRDRIGPWETFILFSW